MLAGLLLWPAASAHADAYLGNGIQVREVSSLGGSGFGGGVSTMSTPMAGTFECSVASATVAAKPSGFAVGNCLNGTHLHRQAKSDWTDTGYYDGGMIFGNFAGCGWIKSGEDVKDNDLTWNDCDPNSIGLENSEYQAFNDGCSGTSSCAGTPITNRYNCNAFGNVRPWLSGQASSDYMRMIPANSTVGGQPRFAWRYLAKYQTTDGNWWVMGRDRAISAGQGNWVFVPYSCL